MVMKRIIISLFFLMILSSCSGFSRSDIGKSGEKCFENGACRDGLICVDGICVNDVGRTDEDQKEYVQDNDVYIKDTDNTHDYDKGEESEATDTDFSDPVTDEEIDGDYDDEIYDSKVQDRDDVTDNANPDNDVPVDISVDEDEVPDEVQIVYPCLKTVEGECINTVCEYLAPDLTVPFDDTILYDKSVEFCWNESSGNPYGYTLSLSLDTARYETHSDKGSYCIPAGEWTTAYGRYDVTEAICKTVSLPYGTYYWHVQAYGAESSGQWSETRKITVGCGDGFSCGSSGWETLFCGTDSVKTCPSETICSADDAGCCAVSEDTSGGHGAIICSKNDTIVKGSQGSAPQRLYGGKIKINDADCTNRLLKQAQYCLTLERLDKTWCYGGVTISDDNYAEFNISSSGLKLDEDIVDGDVLVPSLKNISFDGLDSLITLGMPASYTASDESCGVAMSDITFGAGDSSGNYCTIPANGTVYLSGGFSVELLFCFLDSLGNVTSASDKTISSTHSFTQYKTCSTGMSCADSESELLVLAGGSFSTNRTEECESFLAGTMSQDNIFASKRVALPACQSRCSICQ